MTNPQSPIPNLHFPITAASMRIVALSGGVGGAKLVDGLASILLPENLTAVVNTGDDFDHLGLRICPDLDSVLYALAGLENPETGWGRADETWNFLEALGSLGGPSWFKLGDRDLALHMERTRRLRRGEPLSVVTDYLRRALGVKPSAIPMTDDEVSTVVVSSEGDLPFQEYFVARRCEPLVRGFRFVGIERARPAPGVTEALSAADLVVLCPSNPWVSMDPILAVPGVRELVQAKPVVGVSPLVGGQALKGPAAKMAVELGFAPTAYAIAEHYEELLTALLIDAQDASLAPQIRSLGMQVDVTGIIMRTREERASLAARVLDFAKGILSPKGAR